MLETPVERQFEEIFAQESFVDVFEARNDENSSLCAFVDDFFDETKSRND